MSCSWTNFNCSASLPDAPHRADPGAARQNELECTDYGHNAIEGVHAYRRRRKRRGGIMNKTIRMHTDDSRTFVRAERIYIAVERGTSASHSASLTQISKVYEFRTVAPVNAGRHGRHFEDHLDQKEQGQSVVHPVCATAGKAECVR